MGIFSRKPSEEEFIRMFKSALAAAVPGATMRRRIGFAVEADFGDGRFAQFDLVTTYAKIGKVKKAQQPQLLHDLVTTTAKATPFPPPPPRDEEVVAATDDGNHAATDRDADNTVDADVTVD